MLEALDAHDRTRAVDPYALEAGDVAWLVVVLLRVGSDEDPVWRDSEVVAEVIDGVLEVALVGLV